MESLLRVDFVLSTIRIDSFGACIFQSLRSQSLENAAVIFESYRRTQPASPPAANHHPANQPARHNIFYQTRISNYVILDNLAC